jgi:superfamily II DNA/RNA helicase
VLHRLLSTHQRARHTSARLLITTDVLSEGLSLAGVATVVHLDLPWTAARIDQRVGRAARIGAPVISVRPVSLPAPVPDAAHARLRALLMQKRRAMQPIEAATDACDVLPALRALLVPERASVFSERWATIRSPRCSMPVIVAIVDIRGRRMLVALEGDQLRAPTAADWDLLSGGVATARRSGAVRRLRSLLRAHQADSEMSHVLPPRRDLRRQSRRRTDETLLRTLPAERSRIAAGVTEVRRAASTAERPATIARLRGDVLVADRPSLAATAHDASAARARGAARTALMNPSERHSPTTVASVRIFAGVELLPVDG